LETRQDFLVGLSIVTAIGIVVGALIATSGWLERRYDLYMRVVSAEGLTVDTKVFVQGLEIGRVTRIVPRVDTATRRISFVARLSLAERFADGSRLQLPVGTHAEVAQATSISMALAVRLLLPDATSTPRAMLAAGDTIESERKGMALDEVTEVAGKLSKEVTWVLDQAHTTLVRVAATVDRADRTLQDIAPDVRKTLGEMARTMSRTDSLLERLRGAGFPDSLTAALGNSNRLMLRLDSLAHRAQTMTVENQADLRESVANLAQASRQLNNFVEQMSRRPYRLLTGVKPVPPRDTVHATDPSPPPAKP